MNNLTNKEVTITRTFNAPRELVFKAFVDEQLMKQWFGPRYFTNPYCELDPRPGGKMEIHMQGPDGMIYPNKGVYKEIDEPKWIVFTSTALEDEQGHPQLETLNTVTFEDLGGKTKMTMQIRIVTAGPQAEGPLSGMEEGWNMSFDKLGEELVKA